MVKDGGLMIHPKILKGVFWISGECLFDTACAATAESIAGHLLQIECKDPNNLLSKILFMHKVHKSGALLNFEEHGHLKTNSCRTVREVVMQIVIYSLQSVMLQHRQGWHGPNKSAITLVFFPSTTGKRNILI